MDLRTAASTLALLFACSGEVRFPANPPALAELAGPGARNCGTATNKISADLVYRCASAARSAGRAFFCRYEPAMAAADLSRDLPQAPRGYALSTARIAACGPEYDSAKFTDAVAVSRPAFQGRERALLYVEHSGGARAYHAIRREDRWEIDWYVELWACG